jgi:hypothetical protein
MFNPGLPVLSPEEFLEQSIRVIYKAENNIIAVAGRFRKLCLTRF